MDPLHSELLYGSVDPLHSELLYGSVDPLHSELLYGSVDPLHSELLYGSVGWQWADAQYVLADTLTHIPAPHLERCQGLSDYGKEGEPLLNLFRQQLGVCWDTHTHTHMYIHAITLTLTQTGKETSATTEQTPHKQVKKHALPQNRLHTHRLHTNR